VRKIALVLAALAAVGGTLAAARPQSVTERNRAVVTDFARLFYTERNVPAAFAKHIVETYIQHNPGIADGRAAAVAALTPKFSNPTARFDVKRIIVDGDYAVIHLHARLTADARGGAVADIYRLKDGKIVEHWDVLQPVPDISANTNTMF
jgi:predicted SnoaL-like aldol condensation-catalyzing enzyme